MNVTQSAETDFSRELGVAANFASVFVSPFDDEHRDERAGFSAFHARAPLVGCCCRSSGTDKKCLRVTLKVSDQFPRVGFAVGAGFTAARAESDVSFHSIGVRHVVTY